MKKVKDEQPAITAEQMKAAGATIAVVVAAGVVFLAFRAAPSLGDHANFDTALGAWVILMLLLVSGLGMIVSALVVGVVSNVLSAKMSPLAWPMTNAAKKLKDGFPVSESELQMAANSARTIAANRILYGLVFFALVVSGTVLISLKVLSVWVAA